MKLSTFSNRWSGGIAVIVDLDGTLYDCENRRKEHLKPERMNFEGFNEAACHDLPHAWCLFLCQALRNCGIRVIFVSGREEKWRDETARWLRKYLNWSSLDYELYMRANEDYRKDAEIKKEILTSIQKTWEVLFCVDDRKTVVDMWRENGLVALQCAEGNF